MTTSSEPNDLAIPDRTAIATEAENPRTRDFHRLGVAGMVALMNQENAAVQLAMDQASVALSAFISAVEPGFSAGGRLIYVGAGTSGRLGVLDASEAPPTFCVPPERIIGIIAGGERSLRLPSEGAEDDPNGALPELEQLHVTTRDALLGIAAGGTTPYVRGALAWAAHLPQPPVTGLLSCAAVAAPAGCGHLIVLATGAEVLTGSTRLKAGTATKQALNTISTVLMARSGRVHGNLMVDVRATNAKLIDRAARIIMRVVQPPIDRATALAALDQAGGSAKTAVVMLQCTCNRTTAEQLLETHGGRLDGVLATQPD